MNHDKKLRTARRLILLTFLGLVIALEIACGINNYQDRNAIMMPGLAAFLAAAFLTPALIGLPFGVWDGLLPWDAPGEKADVRKSILSFVRSLLYLVTALIVHSTLAAFILSVTGKDDMSDFPEALPGFTLISLAVGAIAFAAGNVFTRLIRWLVRGTGLKRELLPDDADENTDNDNEQ